MKKCRPLFLTNDSIISGVYSLIISARRAPLKIKPFPGNSRAGSDGEEDDEDDEDEERRGKQVLIKACFV